ncbi:hypothetical protein ACH0BF_13295 [Pseudobacillus sp. 179-B 2D1 NHS]|uniref:hypothetical protein n=1 Tax=Pseudobacillus sp. 179-B 2D1 NHS TaxID=3374292 RepID=UPI003879A6AA
MQYIVLLIIVLGVGIILYKKIRKKGLSSSHYSPYDDLTKDVKNDRSIAGDRHSTNFREERKDEESF